MIEKMKKTAVICQAAHKDEMLLALRDLGVMHLSDTPMHSQNLDGLMRKRADAVKMVQFLSERSGKDRKGSASGDFESIDREVTALRDEESSLQSEILSLQNERERISLFGSFDTDAFRALEDEGIIKGLWIGSAKDVEALRRDEDVRFMGVAVTGKQKAVLLLSGDIPEGLSLSRFRIPELSLDDIDKSIASKRGRLEVLGKAISDAAKYIPVYEAEIEALDEKIEFEKARESMQGDDISFIEGYIPALDEPQFKAFAEKSGCAYMLSDPEADDNPPTKIRYKGIIRIVKPVFDILGTVPGYREYDISSYFLVFFSLFFAMIMGDAGYGLIFMLIGLVMQLKSKKCSDANLLIYVVGAATFIWGALKEKDISLFAEVGWLIDAVLMYFLALTLVIGESFPISMIIKGIVIGFILVCVFSAQGPGIKFSAGLKSGLAGFFTTFLDTISSFSNLMSYIRLFAVGMASLAIAQSFNSMGGGLFGGILTVLGILVIILGHVLNLVMGLLSVVVHGVRLNLLEFSGALGMEWAGYNYEPFRNMAHDKSANN